MSYAVVGEWCSWLLASGRTAQTVKLRRHQLMRLVADVGDPLGVDTDVLTGWLTSREWAPSTLKSHQDAIRSFYAWAAQTGRVERSPAAALLPVRVPRGVPRPAPGTVVADAVARADERVRLMVLLAAKAGLRRGEISRVHSDDLERDLVGWSLLVKGKGGHRRLVPLVEEVAFALRRRPSGWAFPGSDGGHLSPPRVGELVSELMPYPWTCHTLRHYFASRSYQQTRDIVLVQELMGHVSIETTRRYVAIGQELLRAGVAWAA